MCLSKNYAIFCSKTCHFCSSNAWNFIVICPHWREAIYCTLIFPYSRGSSKEICSNSGIQRSVQSSEQLRQLWSKKLVFLAIFTKKVRFWRSFLPDFHAAVMKLLSRPIFKEIRCKLGIWDDPAFKQKLITWLTHRIDLFVAIDVVDEYSCSSRNQLLLSRQVISNTLFGPNFL